MEAGVYMHLVPDACPFLLGAQKPLRTLCFLTFQFHLHPPKITEAQSSRRPHSLLLAHDLTLPTPP